MIATTQRVEESHADDVAPILVSSRQQVKRATSPKGRRRKVRRQSHGLAWHWKQTDAWYYTLPGTKKRVPLFDEEGRRIRGTDNKAAAQLAMARIKLGRGW